MAVVVHGGFWRARYGAAQGDPLARDLACRGIAAYNIEYRRVGDGGGWPTTLTDVGAAVDRLAGPDVCSPVDRHGELRLDVARVVTVGHSAGGQLAVWAAARSGLPAGAPGSGPIVRPIGAISQAGVLDLVGAALDGVGGLAVPDLLGGSPAEVPERYALASPSARVPLGVPVRCVHATGDVDVPYSQSAAYVDSAKLAGDDAELLTVEGDHFTVTDVWSAAWTETVALLDALFALDSPQ